MTGGALLAALMTVPAYAAPAAAQACDNTSTTITSSPPSPVNGATNVTITAHVVDLDQTPLTPVGTVQLFKDATLIGTPAVDGSGNATTNTFMSTGFHTLKAVYAGGTTNNVTFCGSTASTSYLVNGATTTTTTPVPPPVGGTVTYPTCAAAARAGVYDIPRSDPRYRTYLDRDRDGIACERNGQDNPPPPVTIVKPAPTTIVQPPATIVTPGPTIQGPSTVVPGPVVQGPATVLPGPVFQSPAVPSGPVATGDGSLSYLAR